MPAIGLQRGVSLEIQFLNEPAYPGVSCSHDSTLPA